MSASALTGALFCENKHNKTTKTQKQYKSEVLRMKKMIVLFLILGVFLAGVLAAVAYSIGYNSGYNHVIYSQEIYTNKDGYSIVIDGQEHLYN